MISDPACHHGHVPGPPAQRREPERTCLGCRSRVGISELLRVVARGSTVVPDPRRRMAGRGAHVHPDPRCLALAVKRRAFPRALRVVGPLDVAAVERQMGPDVARPEPAGPDRHQVRNQAEEP